MAITVNTRVIKLFLHKNELPYIPFRDGRRLQVLENISELPRAQKHQFAAFISDPGLLVIWDDEPQHVLERATNLQNEMMELIWTNTFSYPEFDKGASDAGSFNAHSKDNYSAETDEIHEQEARRIPLYQALITASTLICAFTTIGAGWQKVAVEVLVDHSYLRLTLILVLPAQIWLGLVSDSFLFYAIDS